MEDKDDMVPTSTAIAPNRRKGSGRPRGTYILKQNVVDCVKDYLNYSGTAAHARRREDIAR